MGAFDLVWKLRREEIAMELRRRFGNLVAAHRRRRGFTQEKLSNETGISPDMISRIETGGTGVSFANIEALAKGLNVDPAALFIVDPVPGRDMRSALLDLTAWLAKLSDDDLQRAINILNAALADHLTRTRVSKAK